MKNDNAVIVGKLVIKGAKEIQECLKYAEEEKRVLTRALLLVIMAAQTGDIGMVEKLFGNPIPELQDVQLVLHSENSLMLVPLEIARRNAHRQAREELLLKINVNQEEGYVNWNGLRLLQLELSWLRKISWVKELRLSSNGFRVLPEEMGHYLNQVSISSTTNIITDNTPLAGTSRM